MKALIATIGFVVGSLIFSWGYRQGKKENPAVYRLDPEIQKSVFTMKSFVTMLDETKPGHIRLIGNGVWLKQRYIAGKSQ